MPDSPAGGPPAFYDDLDLTLAEAWRLLSEGADQRDVPFHTPTLATVGLDGQPQIRTVVLRGVDTDRWALRVHTDARSAKVPEIVANPAISVHGYDPHRKVQVRMMGRATVHRDDPIADDAWHHSPLGCRRIYRGLSTCGGALPSPYDVTEERSGLAEAGRDNFCVVLCRIRSLEWLYLAAKGHRRARFVWQGDHLSGTWLVP